MCRAAQAFLLMEDEQSGQLAADGQPHCTPLPESAGSSALPWGTGTCQMVLMPLPFCCSLQGIQMQSCQVSPASSISWETDMGKPTQCYLQSTWPGLVPLWGADQQYWQVPCAQEQEYSASAGSRAWEVRKGTGRSRLKSSRGWCYPGIYQLNCRRILPLCGQCSRCYCDPFNRTLWR